MLIKPSFISILPEWSIHGLSVAGLAVAIALYEFYAQRNNTVTASNNNGGFEEDGI